MKKYIMIALCIINFLNCMETSNEWYADSYYNKGYTPPVMAHLQIINKYPLTDLTIFNLNSDEGIAAYIAQRAKLVYSVNEISDRSNSTDHKSIQQKYSHIHNLTFTDPEKNKYDLITFFGATGKRIGPRLFGLRDYLKPSGEILATIVTQTNHVLIEESIAQQLYPQIYALMSPEKQKSPEIKILSKDIKIFSEQKLIPEEKLNNIIYRMSYDIISKTNILINVIIKNKDTFKKLLKIGFANTVLQYAGLSSEQNKYFRNQFVDLIIAQLKENEEKDLLYPVNITEIHLRKAEHTRLKKSHGKRSIY